MPYDASQEEQQAGGGMDVLEGGQETAPSQDQEQAMQEPQLAKESGTVAAPTGKKEGPSKTAGSGMFTNLKKYIEANKPKTKAMAGDVAKGVVGQAEKAKEAAAQKTQQFQQAEPYQQEKARLEGGEQFTQQAMQQAETGQQFTPEQLQKFTALRTGEGAYKGIQGPDYTKQLEEARKAEVLGQQAISAEGSEQALKETIGKDIQGYTAGERGLDLFLMGQDPEARQKMQEQITAGATGVQEAVTAEQAKATQSREALQNLAARYQAGGEQDLAAQLGAREEAAKAGTEARLAGLGTEYQQQQLGEAITGPTYGVDTSSYLSSLTPTAESARTAEEASRLNALAQLAGKSGGYQAGTYEQQLQEAIGAAQGEVGRQQEAYQGETQAIQQLTPPAKSFEAAGNTGVQATYQEMDNYFDQAMKYSSDRGFGGSDIDFMEGVVNKSGISVPGGYGGQNVIWDIIPAKLQKMGQQMDMNRKYGLPAEQGIENFDRYKRLASQYASGTAYGMGGRLPVSMPGWEL